MIRLGINIVNSLDDKGVSFHSLQENITMDKSNSIGQLRFRLFAEIERNLILERSAAAHARERLVGRLEKFTEKNMASLKTLVDSGMPIKNIENSWGVSRTTIYKYIKNIIKAFCIIQMENYGS